MATVAFVIPAYEAEGTVGAVVRDLRRAGADPRSWPIVVVDDGSRDGTARAAHDAGARVHRLPHNQGKGAALRAGLQLAADAGAEAAVTLDADGQHYGAEAMRLALHSAPATTLVLGIRDMAAAGAPRANQRSNRISNFFLSLFSGAPLADSQCGLRRYPIPATLELGVRDDGFAFESEILLRARFARWALAEVPVDVHYPPESERTTHFHVVRDPARIVSRVVKTLVLMRVGR